MIRPSRFIPLPSPLSSSRENDLARPSLLKPDSVPIKGLQHNGGSIKDREPATTSRLETTIHP